MKSLLMRKSIRKYTSQPVPEKIIKDLLHAAMSAPSAANQRPWHFIIVKERATLDAIPEFHPYAGMLREAPLSIVVCSTTELGPFKNYWVQDCAAATQNILTAAVENGLGAVWLGVYPLQDLQAVRDLLKIPDNIMPFSIVSIGYPAEQIESGDRYDNSRVHYGNW